MNMNEYLLPDGYPVSYPVGYPGTELPGNASPSCDSLTDRE